MSADEFAWMSVISVISKAAAKPKAANKPSKGLEVGPCSYKPNCWKRVKNTAPEHTIGRRQYQPVRSVSPSTERASPGRFYPHRRCSAAFQSWRSCRLPVASCWLLAAGRHRTITMRAQSRSLSEHARLAASSWQQRWRRRRAAAVAEVVRGTTRRRVCMRVHVRTGRQRQGRGHIRHHPTVKADRA